MPEPQRACFNQGGMQLQHRRACCRPEPALCRQQARACPLARNENILAAALWQRKQRTVTFASTRSFTPAPFLRQLLQRKQCIVHVSLRRNVVSQSVRLAGGGGETLPLLAPPLPFDQTPVPLLVVLLHRKPDFMELSGGIGTVPLIGPSSSVLLYPSSPLPSPRTPLPRDPKTF